MDVVFVDTNILLDFYRRGINKYRSLLVSLSEIGENIFITDTIIAEFHRNKLNAYLQTPKIEKTNLRIPFPDVFPHASEDTTAIETINSRRRALQAHVNAEIDVLYEGLHKIYIDNVRAISLGTDDVSRGLRPIEVLSVHETEEQLHRARDRKERGKPPGKKHDPLGDQISWEQLLDKINGDVDLWLITRDTDHFVTVEKEHLVLNPFLRSELRAKGIEQVQCFTELATFFEQFKPQRQDKHTPISVSDADVAEAKKEIKSVIDTRRLSLEKIDTSQSFPPYCPNTEDHQHVIEFAAAKQSRFYSGWTYQGICSACGAMVDTGEPIDD